ncbi:MAG: hypothetical protein A3K23_06325 [Desulfobacca sp. RBG_16_58_9]|nr:MAG: hypothetical protein A3K23_06325 [Desulfobacca sp. RBG_16_58_9]
MDPKARSVKINPEELESLLRLKSILDHKAAVSSYAEKYLKLGWVLQAFSAQDGTDLGVNFSESPEPWVNRLWEPALSGSTINLGVRTGRESRLLVLEVDKDGGEAILDQYGTWRAECIAALGASRERHFYAWGPEPLRAPASFLDTPEIKCFGEGQVALLPPSFDPEMGETWQWLTPPWETPPQNPSHSLYKFFQPPLSREPQAGPEINLSWQEIYCLVAPHEPLLEALSASYPSMENYYQGILEAAAMIGINAPEVLLSLLWHAPGGNARQHPEIWDYLQRLVAAADDQSAAPPSPGNVPWELFLDNAISLARETSANLSGQASDQTGPSGSFQRLLATPPQPGAAVRTPFSCRKTREDLSKV